VSEQSLRLGYYGNVHGFKSNLFNEIGAAVEQKRCLKPLFKTVMQLCAYVWISRVSFIPYNIAITLIEETINFTDSGALTCSFVTTLA